jgi:hypothetical protein
VHLGAIVDVPTVVLKKWLRKVKEEESGVVKDEQIRNVK